MANMTYERLSKYRRLADEARALERELRSGRQATLADTVQGSMHGPPYALQTIRIAGAPEAEAAARGQKNTALRARVREIQVELQAIEDYVDAVRDPVMRLCMTLHFLEGRTWAETSREVYGARGQRDYARVMVSRYMRRME